MPMKVLEDTSMELAPVDHRQAMAMLDRLQGKASLSGYRGSVPVDLGRLAGIICRLSELAADQRDRIGVFSVALAVLPGSGIMATDALIVPAQRIPPHNS